MIRQINDNDLHIIKNRLAEVFNKTSLPNNVIWDSCQPINMKYSIVIEVDGVLAGFYLLRPRNITDFFKHSNFMINHGIQNMIGIEGIALGVFTEYKNLGLGKILIEYPKNYHFDYIWGLQLKSLNNINHWLKRRKLFLETDICYVTYEIYKNEV